MTELRGTVEHVLHQDGRGWCAARLCAGAARFRAVGTIEDPRVGETWLLQGDWEEHPEHGRQFRVGASRPDPPCGEDELIALLSGEAFPGIGRATAAAVVHAFPGRVLEVLEQQPELLGGVLSPRQARLVRAGARQLAGRWRLCRLLADAGLPPRLLRPLATLYGDGAADRIEADPYRLLAFLPWSATDRLARRLGVERTDPRRLNAALHAVQQERLLGGHTATARDDLIFHALRRTSCPPALIGAALERSALVRTAAATGEIVQLPGVCTQERTLAAALVRLLDRDRPLAPPERAEVWLAGYERARGLQLSPEQREAVRAALRHRLLVLTGGPGTGKTTVLDAICQALQAFGCTIELAAPTGRAARRLAQSTGREAVTLHRLLDYSGATFSLRRRAPFGALVVDECSMVDLRLWTGIATALDDHSRLVVVGDAAQLPPVGPGRVFHDLVTVTWLPVIRLQRVYRQSEGNVLPAIAAEIRQGRVPLIPPWRGEAEGVHFIALLEEARGADLAVRLVTQGLPRYGVPPTDIQVLSPRRSGPCGTVTLNRAVRLGLGLAPDAPFAVGERVIQTANNYDLGAAGVMNGQVGIVTDVGHGGVVVTFDGNETVPVEAEALADLDPAYAITAHKSQGSEYPVVVLPLYRSAGPLLTRAVLYTALTRATHLALIVGTDEALHAAIANASGSLRTTGLPFHLECALAGSPGIDRSCSSGFRA